MDQIRRALATIRDQATHLSGTQKTLIGALGVIMALSLVLVSNYAARPRMAELMPGVSPEQQVQAIEYMDTSGIEYSLRDGRPFVPVERKRAVLAQLGQSGSLPNNTEILFQNLVEHQSWQNSKQQNDQLFIIALQNELSRVITEFSGIQSARVLMDIPEPKGIGGIHRAPTASVSIQTEGGRALSQDMVDSIARLVAGARAGLNPTLVEVIDAVTGKSRHATSEDDLLATDYIDQQLTVEKQVRNKLEALLGYIPGVIVAVTAEVDVKRTVSNDLKYHEKKDGTVSLTKTDMASTESQSNPSNAAEPGIRSNTGSNPASAGGGAGSSFERGESETEMENHVGRITQDIVDPGGRPTRLAATINIPRSYVVGEVKRLAQAAAAEGEELPEPTDAEIQQHFDTQVRPGVEQSVVPHLKLTDAQGQTAAGDVTVGLIPLDVVTAGVASIGGGGGLGGIGGGLLAFGSGGLVDKVVLVATAAGALGLMFMMVKRASKKPEMPSVHELVGIPRPLEAASDIIGEADESDNPMAGIEVGEGDMNTRKMLDQVGQLIDGDTGEVTRVMNKWIAAEE